MYAPVRRGRRPLRDKMLDSLAVQKAYAAAMSPDDPRAAANKERFERHEALVPAAPKARALRRPVDGRPVVPLEKDVLAGIVQLLSVHPRVLFAIRINSGSSVYTNAAGREVPLFFFRWIRSPMRCRMADIFGATTDYRMMAIEVKRPGWSKPTDRREEEQAAFLQIVRDAGGIGIFATDAEQVAEALK